jgi:hypothetical protein
VPDRHIKGSQMPARSVGSVKVGSMPTRPNLPVGALVLKKVRDMRQGRRMSLTWGGVGQNPRFRIPLSSEMPVALSGASFLSVALHTQFG